MNNDTYEDMLTNSAIVEIIKYTTAAIMTEDQPVQKLRGMKITLADATANTADPDDTAVYQNVLVHSTEKDCAIVAFVKLGDPLNFGVTFVSRANRVQRWRGAEGEDREGEFIKASKIYCAKVLSVGSAYLIMNVEGNK
jgi:hypothetical protein